LIHGRVAARGAPLSDTKGSGNAALFYVVKKQLLEDSDELQDCSFAG
jgi:hypothetical protein